VKNDPGDKLSERRGIISFYKQKNTLGEEFSGVRIFGLMKKKIGGRIIRQKIIRSALKIFKRKNLLRRTVRAKNSPTKDYPLSAKKTLGEELFGEESVHAKIFSSEEFSGEVLSGRRTL
jgi:hypothetical protein